MQITNWREAEYLAVAYMKALGFKNASLTVGGADGGVDVVSNEGVAQVKFEAQQIGRPTLQAFVGATVRTGQLRLFFTGTGYSSAALEYADDTGMALFTYALDGKVQPVNGAACALMAVTEEKSLAEVAAEGASSRERGAEATSVKPDGDEVWNVVVGATTVAIPMFIGAFYVARMGGVAWLGAAILVAIGLVVASVAVSTVREYRSPAKPAGDLDPAAREQSYEETRPGVLEPMSDSEYTPLGPWAIDSTGRSGVGRRGTSSSNGGSVADRGTTSQESRAGY